MALQIVLTGKDKSKATLAPAIKGFKSAFAGAFKSNERLAKASATRLKNIFGGVGKGIKKVLGAATSPLGLALGGAGVALGFKRILDGAGQLEVSMKVASKATGLSGKKLESYIDTINDASFGLISFRKASQLAAKSAISGIDTADLRTLVEFTSKAATAAGENAAGALNVGLEQLARGERVLGRFGLGKDLQGVGLAFDEKFGEGAFKSLSQLAQKGVFLKSVIGEMRDRLKDMALTGNELVFKFASLGGSISDITDRLGIELFGGQGFGGKFRLFADTLGLVAKATREKGGPAKILKALGSQIIPLLGAAFESLGALITRGFLKTIRPLVEGGFGKVFGLNLENLDASLKAADAQQSAIFDQFVSSTAVFKRAANEALGRATPDADRTIGLRGGGGRLAKSRRRKRKPKAADSAGLGQAASIRAAGEALGLTPVSQKTLLSLDERRSASLQGLIDEREGLNAKKRLGILSLDDRSRIRTLDIAFRAKGRGDNRSLNKLLPGVGFEAERALTRGTSKAVFQLQRARSQVTKLFLEGEIDLRDKRKKSRAINEQIRALKQGRGDAEEMARALNDFNKSFGKAAVEAKKAAQQSKDQLAEAAKRNAGANPGAP